MWPWGLYRLSAICGWINFVGGAEGKRFFWCNLQLVDKNKTSLKRSYDSKNEVFIYTRVFSEKYMESD